MDHSAFPHMAYKRQIVTSLFVLFTVPGARGALLEATMSTPEQKDDSLQKFVTLEFIIDSIGM